MSELLGHHLKELFAKYDERLHEYIQRERLIVDVIREHDHTDESRPE